MKAKTPEKEMIIIEAVGVLKKKKEDPLPQGKVTMLGVDMPRDKDQVGNGIFLAIGATTPVIIGSMARDAWFNGNVVGPVHLTFKGQIPEGKEFREIEDIKESTILDIRRLKKKPAMVILEIWQEWLKSGDPLTECVAPEFREPSRQVIALRDRIARHPAFLHYLLQQEGFRHLEGVAFQFGWPKKGGVGGFYLDKVPKQIQSLSSPWAPGATIEFPAHLTSKNKADLIH